MFLGGKILRLLVLMVQKSGSNHLGCIIPANNGMINWCRISSINSINLHWNHQLRRATPKLFQVPGGSFSQFRRDFECNSIRASPRSAGKPKVFPRFVCPVYPESRPIPALRRYNVVDHHWSCLKMSLRPKAAGSCWQVGVGWRFVVLKLLDWGGW